MQVPIPMPVQEFGVASTKAFTAQVAVLTILAWYCAEMRGAIQQQDLRRMLVELERIPAKVQRVSSISAKKVYCK